MSKLLDKQIETARRREAEAKRKQERLAALAELDRAGHAMRTAKTLKQYSGVKVSAHDIITACDKLEALEALDAPKAAE